MWKLHTDADGTITAARKAPPGPTPTRGETTSHEFSFNSQSDFDTLVHYLDYAGQSARFIADDGTPWFRELQTGSSLLVGFESTLSSTNGFWGLIVGGSNLTELSGVDLNLELSVFYLGEYGDYADHTAVRNNHEK